MQIERNEQNTKDYLNFANHIFSKLEKNPVFTKIDMNKIDKGWKAKDYSSDVRIMLDITYFHNEKGVSRTTTFDLQYIYLDYKAGLSIDDCVKKVMDNLDIVYESDVKRVNETLDLERE